MDDKLNKMENAQALLEKASEMTATLLHTDISSELTRFAHYQRLEAINRLAVHGIAVTEIGSSIQYTYMRVSAIAAELMGQLTNWKSNI